MFTATRAGLVLQWRDVKPESSEYARAGNVLPVLSLFLRLELLEVTTLRGKQTRSPEGSGMYLLTGELPMAALSVSNRR